MNINFNWSVGQEFIFNLVVYSLIGVLNLSNYIEVVLLTRDSILKHIAFLLCFEICIPVFVHYFLLQSANSVQSSLFILSHNNVVLHIKPCLSGELGFGSSPVNFKAILLSYR